MVQSHPTVRLADRVGLLRALAASALLDGLGLRLLFASSSQDQVSLGLDSLSLAFLLGQFHLQLLVLYFILDLPVHQVPKLLGNLISATLRADELRDLANFSGKIDLHVSSHLLSSSEGTPQLLDLQVLQMELPRHVELIYAG